MKKQTIILFYLLILLNSNYLKAQWIPTNGPFGGATKEGNSLHSGRKFIRKKLPNLIKNDLLRPTDFRMKSDGTTNKTERIIKPTGRRGQVMFGSVRHILGSKFEPYKNLW